MKTVAVMCLVVAIFATASYAKSMSRKEVQLLKRLVATLENNDQKRDWYYYYDDVECEADQFNCTVQGFQECLSVEDKCDSLQLPDCDDAFDETDCKGYTYCPNGAAFNDDFAHCDIPGVNCCFKPLTQVASEYRGRVMPDWVLEDCRNNADYIKDTMMCQMLHAQWDMGLE